MKLNKIERLMNILISLINKKILENVWLESILQPLASVLNALLRLVTLLLQWILQANAQSVLQMKQFV